MTARPDPLAAPETPSAAAPARWAPAALAVLAAGLALAAYWPYLVFRANTAVSISVEGWFFEPSDRTPGVIVLLAFWLVWRRRKRLARLAIVPGPWPLTAALLAVGVGGFVWSVRSHAPDLLGLSLLFNSLAVANGLAGVAAIRALALPAVVLLLSVPIPAPLANEVLWTLQIWTADYTGALLYSLGQPALVSGDRIIRADSVFAIIETCSGLRSIETLLLLAALMADLFGRRGLHTALLLLAAPFVAFFINGIRALLLILVPGSEIDAIHSAQGIAMLLAGVLILYAFDGLLERALQRRRRLRPVQTGEPAAVLPRLAGVVALAAGLAAVGAWLPPWPWDAPTPVLPVNAVSRDLGEWRGADLQTEWLFYGRIGYRQAIHRRYARGRERVDVFVATGAREQRSRSLLSPKTALPGSGWIVESEGRDARDGRDVLWRVVRKGGDRRLVQHWTLGLEGLPTESVRTLLALDAGPLRRADEPVVVRLATPLGPDAAARSAAEARLASVALELEAPLAELHGGA